MMKKVFDINSYKDSGERVKFCMHCKTLEESEIFLKFLFKLGRSWRDGSCYTGFPRGINREMVYYFNRGTYGSVETAVSNKYDAAKNNGVIIIEFDDFYWGKECKFMKRYSNEKEI